MYGLILLLLVQLTELRGSPSWVGLALAVGWAALLVVFCVWAPWLLTHKLVSRRDLLPGAVPTAVGLVVLMLVSSVVMEFWVNLFARDYGGFGVMLAIYLGCVQLGGDRRSGERLASARDAAHAPARRLFAISRPASLRRRPTALDREAASSGSR